MRNPKWSRDEIILALDLYFRTEAGQIHANNPEVLAISEILNKLPIHEVRPDQAKFRNPNGVGLKLSNFLAIDPNYPGKGMESYSKLDEEIFHEFADNRAYLKKLADRIKRTVENPIINNKLYQIPDEDDEEVLCVREGLVIYKLHKYRERNNKINKKKKEQHLKKFGKLACEACLFDFYKFYGELGKGFIECHHLVPLSEIDEALETKLDDLALVCANCHRMLHRAINTLGIQDLKSKIYR